MLLEFQSGRAVKRYLKSFQSAGRKAATSVAEVIPVIRGYAKFELPQQSGESHCCTRVRLVSPVLEEKINKPEQDSGLRESLNSKQGLEDVVKRSPDSDAYLNSLIEKVTTLPEEDGRNSLKELVKLGAAYKKSGDQKRAEMSRTAVARAFRNYREEAVIRSPADPLFAGNNERFLLYPYCSLRAGEYDTLDELETAAQEDLKAQERVIDAISTFFGRSRNGENNDEQKYKE